MAGVATPPVSVADAPATAIVPERERLLENEVERLGAELAHLEARWKTKHWLAVFGVLAIPAFIFAGALWGIGVLMATPCLVATQAYLIGMRRAECKQLILQTKRDLGALRAARA
jgi:hypothetical protein